MKILIIEDELEIRETLAQMLELNGHTVLAAEDGESGLELAEQQPDLIFCDIGLPGMDGYQVIQALRELPSCRDTPFIFLTARVSRADQRLGMKLGADDYITKPFTQQELNEAIEARVQRQRPLRERVGQLVEAHQHEVDAHWSHELMTPLNGILGGLAILEAESDRVSPAELKELLGIIRAGAERQLQLSRKLVRYFDLERMKEAPASIRGMLSQAEAALARATSRAAKQANRPGDLRLHIQPGQLAIPEALIIDAVAELVGNAFRFSSSGQPVSVTGIQEGNVYRVEVIDQGPGMTAGQVAKVRAFVQFDRENREQQGLGLGLAIAQSVAELGGGRLTLEPGSGGCGLKATLSIRIAQN